MADGSAVLKAILIGTVTGLRSMTGVAFLANSVKPKDFHLPRRYRKFLKPQTTGRALIACAAGEIVADKLPFMPARTEAPSLAARAALGAACGAALYQKDRLSPVHGALLGLCGALAGSFAGYHVRRAATRRGVPDFAAAMVEDGIALATAAAITRPPEKQNGGPPSGRRALSYS